ncbi:hypothetical protein HDV00_003684 [Rhizophlyctis rosea]|nr:hypothetical protein HDV00_003684 [Rhizophlyctis rosea]
MAQILPGTEAVFRNTRAFKYTEDLYGSDFILLIKKGSEQHVGMLYLADTLVKPGRSSIPQPEITIHPRKPWQAFLQSAQGSKLEFLVPHLEAMYQCPLGHETSRIRQWLWFGKNERNSLEKLMTFALSECIQKVSHLMYHKVMTAVNQMKIYDSMNLDRDRRHQIDINIKRRVLTELTTTTPAREILQIENVLSGDLDEHHRDLLGILDDFRKTKLMNSVWFEQLNVKRLLGKVGTRMFEEGEKEMWWVEGKGSDKGSSE